eukprot:CAMPEP_0114586268 /NCGR_PEP_ID=MMETSP0125-20121206/9542_1 /TAXON_ID=485358 ORGANISM="Aristerostoma sp., Strain ATCC 50986" /NCGR_SAMPLE_ID=MMETSP0125 /ASSEMBLY_ACC=CAM_ASM_000245 /LENGTH=37 /DNA_ID= /DNA_START= /DNA_END= /DNA_ORIENTATION=
MATNNGPSSIKVPQPSLDKSKMMYQKKDQPSQTIAKT